MSTPVQLDLSTAAVSFVGVPYSFHLKMSRKHCVSRAARKLRHLVFFSAGG